MDQSSSSEFTISKRQSRGRRNKSREEKEKQGRWSSEQNLKYLVFLSYNMAKFQCRKKRMFRLYKPLSKFITTRTSEQCRSHHRKLLQRFKTPKNIVTSLEHQFDRQQIAQSRQAHNELLQQLPIPQKKIKTNDKQEQLPHKSLQKNLSQNQIPQNLIHPPPQLNQKNISSQEIIPPLNQNPLLAHLLKSPPQLPSINYQALNWFNTLYYANLNLFLQHNALKFYNACHHTSSNLQNY